MCCIDVVLDSAGLDGSTGDGFPLDEQDGVASEEVVLQCWVWEVEAQVVDIHAAT